MLVTTSFLVRFYYLRNRAGCQAGYARRATSKKGKAKPCRRSNNDRLRRNGNEPKGYLLPSGLRARRLRSWSKRSARPSNAQKNGSENRRNHAPGVSACDEIALRTLRLRRRSV